MDRAFAEEAAKLRRKAGLSADQIARATGAAASTVRGWIGRRSEPTGARAERIAELAAITERLERVMPKRYIAVWLSQPIEALDDRKPRWGGREVWRRPALASRDSIRRPRQPRRQSGWIRTSG